MSDECQHISHSHSGDHISARYPCTVTTAHPFNLHTFIHIHNSRARLSLCVAPIYMWRYAQTNKQRRTDANAPSRETRNRGFRVPSLRVSLTRTRLNRRHHHQQTPSHSYANASPNATRRLPAAYVVFVFSLHLMCIQWRWRVVVGDAAAAAAWAGDFSLFSIHKVIITPTQSTRPRHKWAMWTREL